MKTTDDNAALIEKFLSGYPDYVEEHCDPLVPPGTMERINAALDRARPSKEEWARQITKLKQEALARG
jgi:hypothetical protein